MLNIDLSKKNNRYKSLDNDFNKNIENHHILEIQNEIF